MKIIKEGRGVVIPTLDRTTFIGGLPEDKIYEVMASGQHFVTNDRWSNLRWNAINNSILSWAEPHVNDPRYRYWEDDRIQHVFPEVAAPWKFPEHVFFVSGVSPAPGMDGLMVEPAYCDPDPTVAPKGQLYKIWEHTLPEYGIRVAISGGFQAKATAWGPEHNIEAERLLLLAPLAWQGIRTNQIGETWELQGHPNWSLARMRENPETGGWSYVGVSGRFPLDPLMPHGDPEPLWNDGLDPERIGWKDRHRREAGIRRGSSDKFVGAWADMVQGDTVDADLNDQGELEVQFSSLPYDATEREKLLGKYDFKSTGKPVRWANPAHFGQPNPQNFARQMRKCLFCFKADKCRAANNPVRHATPDAIVADPALAEGRVGTIGFQRNYFVDVPEALVPDDSLAKIYAHTYCMYSTNLAFERNFASIRESEEGLAAYLKRNDNTSDLCHVNGAPRRVVEYDGHYKLLIEEISQPFLLNHRQAAINGHINGTGSFTLDWGNYKFNVESGGTDYQGNHLYKVLAPDPYPSSLIMGQYDFQYGVKNEQPKILFWFSIKFSHAIQTYVIPKVWAYIWYVSPHANKNERVAIKRLVELKADYGKYYGNITEGRTSSDFKGGSNDLKSLPLERFAETSEKRGMYIQQPQGGWLWMDGLYDLSANWGSYRDDSTARASGIIQVVAQPGEIIPDSFLAYSPPKMISWGKSKSDPNTQKNKGKTRWHFDHRYGKWIRETGDIDDLFDHLRYDDPRADGALTNHLRGLPPTEGFFSGDANPSGNYDIPVNLKNPVVKIADQLLTSEEAAGVTTTELNDIRDTDLILKSDMLHARNFTAPIFAYHLTSQVPAHHVVRDDINHHEVDWGRRVYEPDNVAFQREYAPVVPVWCFSKNSDNREQFVQKRVEKEGGGSEIQRIWLPEGRVWWHLRGLLGTGREWGPNAGQQHAGNNFSQTGVAVINLWRKYLPHHMQVVRAYLWLEPVYDHYTAEYARHPFDGMQRLFIDSSAKAQEIRDAKRDIGIHTDIPGHPVIGYPIPIEAAWEMVKTASHKLMGVWEFPSGESIKWDSRKSTMGWTEWDLNHLYEPASVSNEYNIARNLTITLNGRRIQSRDPDRPDSFAQRNFDWYAFCATLFEDGGFRNMQAITGDASSGSYFRNANSFTHLPNRKDHGESDDGFPDPKGKAYGFSSGGGGRKSPFIFDITQEIRKAYNDRMDVEFETVIDVRTIGRQDTSKESGGSTDGQLGIKSVVGDTPEIGNQILRGTQAENTLTQINIAKSNESNVAIFELLIPPPEPETEEGTATINIQYRTANSIVWRTLYAYDSSIVTSSYDIIAVNAKLKETPLICAEVQVTVAGAPMPPVTNINYIGDVSKIPITGPPEVESFNSAKSFIMGSKPLEMWHLPLSSVPAKIEGVFVQENPAALAKVMLFGGYISSHVGYTADAQNPDIASLIDTFWYDPVDNAVLIAKTNPQTGEALYTDFQCAVEYITAVGSQALVPVAAMIPGPTHDVDAESVTAIHPEDLSKLPSDPDLPWAVTNPSPMQGGYQYFEPEYVDTVAQETLEANPDLQDPRQDPAYGGRGTNWIKIGNMPDSFDKEEEDYRKHWFSEATQEVVSNAWKTKARGYVKFYGPPNTIIPVGIRVVAPAYVKPFDPNTMQDILPNSDAANTISTKLNNGGVKPAPVIIELKMEEDEAHPLDTASRKIVAFRPHIMVYLRENTSFKGATHWKEVGEGYGESSEVTGTPYWEV